MIASSSITILLLLATAAHRTEITIDGTPPSDAVEFNLNVTTTGIIYQGRHALSVKELAEHINESNNRFYVRFNIINPKETSIQLVSDLAKTLGSQIVKGYKFVIIINLNKVEK